VAFSYEVVVRSSAPPERIFALLADATSWPSWANPVVGHGSWEREGEPPPGGVGAIRKVGRWPVLGREAVVAHDPPTHHAYTILSGQPVRSYRADVVLTADGTGTVITWGATFEPRVRGTGPALRAFYRRLIGWFAHRVARHAEAHDAPGA